MTRDGSFKRALRRQARAAGRSYTQALAARERTGVAARVGAWKKWKGLSGLAGHFERRYDVRVESITSLSQHGGGILKVNLRDCAAWVARVFAPAARSAELVRGDVEILKFLERHDFPAGRSDGGPSTRSPTPSPSTPLSASLEKGIAMSEAADQFRRRADAFERLIVAMPPDRWTAPSPCDEWTASDVVAHVVERVLDDPATSPDAADHIQCAAAPCPLLA